MPELARAYDIPDKGHARVADGRIQPAQDNVRLGRPGRLHTNPVGPSDSVTKRWVYSDRWNVTKGRLRGRGEMPADGYVQFRRRRSGYLIQLDSTDHTTLSRFHIRLYTFFSVMFLV